MTDKRANSGIWRISLLDDEAPSDGLKRVISDYTRLVRNGEAEKLREVAIGQPVEGVNVTVYIRVRRGAGIYSFLFEHLIDKDQRRLFASRSADTCIFMETEKSLFVVTTGSAHFIIEDYADYSFPFDVAKRLFSNNFKAANVREIAGATTSRVETYRRGHSLSSSEAFGKVWKRLMGRLNTNLLVEGSYLEKLIDPKRPPTLEVKSSLVLRKSLSLKQLVKLALDIEELPPVSEEQRLELSFLDNLYQVNGKSQQAELDKALIELLRTVVLDATTDVDLEFCDPQDISRYYAGANYRLYYWDLVGDPPDLREIVGLLREKLEPTTKNDSKKFAERLCSMNLSYAESDDEESAVVRKSLIKCLHGQLEHQGQTFFRLDAVWYQVRGDFLENLKKDFITEVFGMQRPILLQDGPDFSEWNKTDDEEAYNIEESEKPGFYYGDRIFAVTDRGKVELFDLLYVDDESRELYIVHVKDKFDLHMRDACSQISISAEVIEQDMIGDQGTLERYYPDWRAEQAEGKDVSLDDFLNWFKAYSRVYVVLASTATPFVARSFETNRLRSHIARREIIATRNEFRSNDRVFRLAHTSKIRVKPEKN